MKFLVVGAGMAGVLMGIRLKQAGYTDVTNAGGLGDMPR